MLAGGGVAVLFPHECGDLSAFVHPIGILPSDDVTQNEGFLCLRPEQILIRSFMNVFTSPLTVWPGPQRGR